jgi:transposase
VLNIITAFYHSNYVKISSQLSTIRQISSTRHLKPIVRTPKNQYNTDMSYPIHFRKKILAKLEEGQSIRAVAQHFEINKNTIVEWKKRIEIKRTRPRKPSKVDDDALRADVEQYPDDYQYERAARFGCATSTIGDALKRLNITVKKRPYGTRKQKQNSESSI